MTGDQAHHIAARWLERRQHANWSAEDQAALDTWLGDSTNKVAYLRIEAIWQRTERLTALRRPAREPMRAQLPARNSFWPLFRKTAAGLALAAIIGAVGYQQLHSPMETTYVTAIGEHKSVIFRDGTRVELNTDTVLRVSQSAGTRKAWLDRGEAYFEVEHDAARPFTVIANARKVTDLGTKFTVRQDSGKLHVTVVEGLVEVEAKGEKPQSLLKPGDVLIATQEAQTVTRKPLRSLLAALDWKHGKLFLENTTLAEAVSEFNRYNSRKLVIADPKLAKLTITGIFQTKDLAGFTNATKHLFGIKSEQQTNQIILSR